MLRWVIEDARFRLGLSDQPVPPAYRRDWPPGATLRDRTPADEGDDRAR